MTGKPTHEIHTSMRRSFKGCRRRFGWIFRDNWYPVVTAKPLEFGVAYHRAMEVYYDPITWHLTKNPATQKVLVQMAEAEFVKVCMDQKQKFLRLANVPYLTEDVETDYNERLELGRGMLRYHLGQAPEIDNFTPVRVEVPFEIPVMGPGKKQLFCRIPNCRQHPDGPAPVTFNGRIDCLGEDRDGWYWIIDWKTAARLNVDRHEFLYLDDQLSGYTLALRYLGIKVAGFIYHEQKKAFPLPPPENKTIRLGRKFSVSKQMDTSYALYLKTVEEGDSEAYQAGLYNEMLDYLLEMEKEKGGSLYWQRYQIHKSDDELRSAALSLWQEATEIVNPNLFLYPNPGRFSCMTCAFREPCQEMNSRRDYQYLLETNYERKVKHYWEKETPTTEHTGRVV